MFPLSRREIVDLCSACLQCASVFSSYAKEDQFGDVSEIKTDTSAVRTAVFSNFVPDNIAFISKPPCLHNRQPVRQQGVGNPQIQVACVGGSSSDGKEFDIFHCHGSISCQPFMFRSHLACSVLELPWRIGKDSSKFAVTHQLKKIVRSHRLVAVLYGFMFSRQCCTLIEAYSQFAKCPSEICPMIFTRPQSAFNLRLRRKTQ